MFYNYAAPNGAGLRATDPRSKSPRAASTLRQGRVPPFASVVFFARHIPVPRAVRLNAKAPEEEPCEDYTGDQPAQMRGVGHVRAEQTVGKHDAHGGNDRRHGEHPVRGHAQRDDEEQEQREARLGK